MSYFINPVGEEQCVFLTYEGEMPPVEAVAVRYEATGALAVRHWNRIVVDFTELRVNSTGTVRVCQRSVLRPAAERPGCACGSPGTGQLRQTCREHRPK